MFVNYLYNLKANQIHKKEQYFLLIMIMTIIHHIEILKRGLLQEKKMRIRSYNSYNHNTNQSLSLKYQLKQIDLK